jgi:hypothetical protein
MVSFTDLGRIKSSSEALEASVERARQALACRFSCSEEFEAAFIKARRETGAYGLTARQRHLLWGGALTVLLVSLVIVV